MKPAAQVVRILPLPALSSRLQARIRAGRMEAAKVWMACRDLHREARQSRVKWPNKTELQKATKGRFALHSQTVQMICHAFLANVDTTRQLRLQDDRKARYPYRDKLFYPLLWPAQAMCLDGSRIVLPMGRGRKSLILPRPEWLTRPSACKLVWNGVHDELHITVEAEVAAEPPGTQKATIDLGQIHQATVVTDTGAALIISGRGIRSEKRRMNKMHGELARKLSRCQKGSRRWRKLRAARNKQRLRIERRIRDLRHKGTRQAIDFCITHQVGTLFIGNPDGVRRKNCGRKQNQRMSQWEYGRDIDYLQQKAKRAAIESFTGTERGTSSRCPECGHKQKVNGRNWRCRACDFTGHRDVVGGTNMHPLAFGEKVKFPSLRDTTYRRPGTQAVRRAGMNSLCAGSRSRPDTGQSRGSVAALETADSTTGYAGCRKAQAMPPVLPAEAHPL